MPESEEALSVNAATVMLLIDVITSSSSSDEEEMILNQKCEVPKIEDFIDVVDRMSDVEFKRHFRVERRTAEEIVRQYKTSEYYPADVGHGGSTPISAENDVLLFLWFAGNKVSLRSVAQRFGVGLTTSLRQVERVMAVLMHIAPKIIKFPNDKEKAAADVEEISGFPGILGCIDGTSIKIRTPAHKIKSTYTNRHDVPSLTMQGICDCRKRFIDVFTGVPGKIHDSRVLRLSDISQDLHRLDKSYHFLGDAAYPIREWLLVPFRNCTYNARFFPTRVVIENSFGLLKGRWNQLKEIDMYKVEKMSKFIISCCVLHNLCIDSGDLFPCDEEDEDRTGIDLEEENEIADAVLKRLGEEKRNRIMHSFVMDDLAV